MSRERDQLESGILALEAQRTALGDAVVDAAIAGLRSRLSALRSDPGEETGQTLKQVSILFMDAVGSTSLASKLDPEDVGAVMDGLLSRGTRIVTDHRGRVLKYAGDSLLAVFGADEVAEDDAERAVRCGLALLEAGRTSGAEVQAQHGYAGFGVRVGVHTGAVLLGGGVDEEDSVRGQPVNIAARMEQTAPPGGLRISHDTYRLVRGAFDLDAQAPLQVKGVVAPMRSYLVVRAKPRAFRAPARGIEGVETRMVGRDAEVRTLRAAFERLYDPGAKLQPIVVVADAGVGKSRLLHEFQAWADARTERFHRLQARATPQTRGQPYGMLRDLFTWHSRIVDSDGMETAKRKLEDAVVPLLASVDGELEAQAHAHLLGQLIGLDYGDSRHIRGIRDDARQIRTRGFRAATQALRRLNERDGFPIVVALDDLHWADEGSLDWIEHLICVAHDIPMLLLALTRPALFERRAAALASGGHSVVQRIDLHPLDPRARRALADELLKRLPDMSGPLERLVVDAADGNPFYMEELVKMLVDQGAIVTSGEHWRLDVQKLRRLDVPATLTGVLQARLDGLPEDERRALQLASVIGLTFWDAALAHVEPAAADKPPLLQARGLIDLDDDAATVGDDIREYAFRQQLLHQVTYDTVLRRVKRRAHARVAEWLAQRATARSRSLLATAAEHYERAGDAAHAADFYTRAAEHMAGTFAHDAALDYTTRALDLLDDGDTDLRWRLLANRERVLDLNGRREAQLADIDALVGIAEAMAPGNDRDLRRADAAWRRADIAHRTGDWETQAREAGHAQRLAERAGDEPLALRAMQRLAQAIAHGGDAARGRVLAEEGLARARAAGLPAEESRLLNAATVCTDLLGDRVAGLAYSLLDLSLNRAVGNQRNEAVALSNVGMSYLAFGAFDEARRHLLDALQLNRTLGNRAIEGNTQSMLSELAWREHDYPLALTRARAARDISVEVGSRLYEADSLWSLGNAELGLGNFDASTEAFERSETIAKEIGQGSQRINALEGQARVALARGNAGHASQLCERLLDAARQSATQSQHGAAQGTPARNLFAGAYEHLARLTLCRVWCDTGDARATGMLDEAHAALKTEIDRIHDGTLRDLYVTAIAEHRAILALWDEQRRDTERPRK